MKTERKIKSLKELNFKIKLVKNLELEEKQYTRISNLIKKEVSSKEEIEEALYKYKRQILSRIKEEATLLERIDLKEEIHKEDGKFFIASIFLENETGVKLGTFHSPLTGKNVEKKIEKLKKRKLKQFNEVIDGVKFEINLVKEEIEKQKAEAKEDKSIVVETSGVIFKNRKTYKQVISSGENYYKSLISTLGKLNCFLNTNAI